MDTQDDNKKTNLVIKRQVQVEAVSRAIYLITDLFDKDEPLRMSLRRSAIECIDNSDKKESFLKLISLISLSKNVGLITDMNASILINVLNSKVEYLNNKVDENRSDIDVSQLIKEEREVIDKVETAVVSIDDRVDEIEKVENKKPQNTSITIHNNTQNIKTITNISMDIGSRRKRILEIVKTRGAVTINEFMDSIKGCSSKTIQRELTSLVLSGNLKKTGERRWSKYSLK